MVPEGENPQLAWLTVYWTTLWHAGCDHINEISARLYLGDIVAASDADLLDAHNITHVVSITQFGNAAVFYPRRYDYKVFRMQDVPESDIGAILTEASAHLDAVLRSSPEARVFVHCNAGRSRSATLAASYLVRYHNKTPDEAWEHLELCRSLVRPNAGFKSQLNSWFVQTVPIERVANHMVSQAIQTL